MNYFSKELHLRSLTGFKMRLWLLWYALKNVLKVFYKEIAFFDVVAGGEATHQCLFMCVPSSQINVFLKLSEKNNLLAAVFDMFSVTNKATRKVSLLSLNIVKHSGLMFHWWLWAGFYLPGGPKFSTSKFRW